MTLKEYLKQLVEQFSEAEGKEVTGVKSVDINVGLTTSKSGVIIVDQHSPNKVSFTLEIKRA